MREHSNNSGHADLGAVRSVQRAVQILEQLSAAGGATLSQLARETRLSVSTCHRLLTTLQALSFVRYERASGKWSVGHRALAVGASFAHARDLVGLARPIMLRAARESGHIVNLGISSGTEVTFVQRIDPFAPRAPAGPAMQSIPVHCSSIGKAILSRLHEYEVRDLIKTRGLVSRTARSITRTSQLLADLRSSDERGFAIDDEENTVGLRCVAACVFDEFSRPIAAVSIAAATERLQGEQVAAFGRIVRSAALDVTRAYGGVTPTRH